MHCSPNPILATSFCTFHVIKSFYSTGSPLMDFIQLCCKKHLSLHSISSNISHRLLLIFPATSTVEPMFNDPCELPYFSFPGSNVRYTLKTKAYNAVFCQIMSHFTKLLRKLRCNTRDFVCADSPRSG